MNEPLFTIVTPALNCGAYLARNISSVKSQGLPQEQVEHWIIDGGSTDSSLEILKSTPGIKWISEKDRGLSEAVNKGITRASGQWIIWLNADDELAPGALKIVLQHIQKHPDIKIFAGDQNIYDYEGNLECYHAGRAYTFQSLLEENTDIAHASIVVHREVFTATGLIDPAFKYAMDYEWIVRACKIFACVHIQSVLTNYHRRAGSIMDAGIYGQHKEFLKTRRMHQSSYLTLAELRIRFYILTQPLRKIEWFRSTVRKIKTGLGLAVQHRYEAK